MLFLGLCLSTSLRLHTQPPLRSLSKQATSEGIMLNVHNLMKTCPEFRMIYDQVLQLSSSLKQAQEKDEDFNRLSMVVTYKPETFLQIKQNYESVMTDKIAQIGFASLEFDQQKYTITLSLMLDAMFGSFVMVDATDGETAERRDDKSVVLTILIDALDNWLDQVKAAFAGIDKKQKINPVFAEQLLQIFGLVELIGIVDHCKTEMVTKDQAALMNDFISFSISLNQPDGSQATILSQQLHATCSNLLVLQEKLNADEVTMKKIQTTAESLWSLIVEYQSQQIIC